MFRLYRKELELQIRIKVNAIAYFLRKIPVLRALVKGDAYRFGALKRVLIAFAPLTRLMDLFLSSFFSLPLLYFIVYGYSILFRLSEAQIPPIILCLYLIHTLSRYRPGNEAQTLRQFHELFQVPPALIVRSKLFFDAPLKMVGRGLAFQLLGRFAGVDAATAWLFSVSLYGLELFSNAFYTMAIGRGWFRFESLILRMVQLLLFAGLAVLTVIFSPDMAVLIRFFLFPAAVLLGMAGAFFLVRYRHFTRDFEERILPSMQLAGMDTQAILRESTRLKDRDLVDSADLNRRHSGYALLNALFFRRHRRLLLRPFLVKSGIFTGILLAGTLYLFFPVWGLPPLPADEIARSIPGILPFLAYLLFNQDSMTQKMFINCDQAFLQYGFYRRSVDLLRMFSLRLRRVFLWNLIPLSVSLALLTVAFRKIGIPAANIAVYAVQLLALAFFFSVHTLFVYYMFQPYNADLKMKNPVYALIQAGVYFLCFLTMQLGIAGFAVAPVFITAAILYSAIALWSVRRYAPARFRVRD